MCRRLVPLTGGLVLLCAASLCAQEAALEQTFGSGVHSYFSKDYEGAFDLLSQAIEAGSPDPRCYYFRGLCYIQLGREDEAKRDFEKGAELETLDLNRFFNVARSLERIQGRLRVLLEGYRSKARMVALEREQERRRKRYEAIRQQESRVLQQQAAEASAELPAAAGTPAADAPFGLAPIESVEAADVEPPALAEPAPIEPAPADIPAVPAADDPFSAAPADEPVEDPMVTAASAELPLEEGAGRRIAGALGRALSKALGGGNESDGPFDLVLPAADDPFADDAPPSAAKDASADDAPIGGHGHGHEAMLVPTDEDPFADDTPAPVAPAKDVPAADPFADDAPPSTAPAEDAPAADPFADP